MLVAGTASDVGKSTIVAGICRWLHRRGVQVAPFKAQNMSLNSAVTDDGGEIGRAQAAQAAAAGLAAEAAMNPILLKPSGEHRSQIIVMGRAVGVHEASSYLEQRDELLPVVLNALESLRQRFDVVVCEGAGSLAEPNIRRGDLVNLGLARAANLPVLIVADLERGGAFAAAFGSLTILDPDDQRLVSGFLLNKFRGDPRILGPAIDRLVTTTSRAVLGVLPWSDGLELDSEDSLALDTAFQLRPDRAGEILSVAVVRLPRISNFTDFEPLAREPGVNLRWTTSPSEIVEADLVVLPGTKATVDDLAWLRARGLAEALRTRVDRGGPTLGVCGGYQMLGRRIVDHVESGVGRVEGLGLLPVETVFDRDKLLANRSGTARAWPEAPVAGYEIRHGRTRELGGEPVIDTSDGPEGCWVGPVVGTSWHGIFEGDEFRRAFLRWVATERGRAWLPGSHSFASLREKRLDRIADLIEGSVDTERMLEIMTEGPRRALPAFEFKRQDRPDRGDASGQPAPVPHRLRLHGDRMVPPGHLDFAVNVVPGGPPRWLHSRLRNALDAVARYPDEREVATRLAAHWGRSPAEVLPTNGAAEAFWLLAAVLRPRRAVVIHPAFTEPEAALRAFGRPTERVFRRADDFALHPRQVPDDADLVFVCNPNNPTGTLDRAERIAQLVRRGRIVVVDEAFMDFCPEQEETLGGRSDLPGLVVVRSVTKLWSLPGLRAGYLLGPADTLARLREARQPWPLNTLACTALDACIDAPGRREIAETVAA
ncbi:MAG TPA: cobyric acid synthase, partial [Candidatus Caenarcaniphilales bacterium]|nr:cobyric acid synthase [Candidatus Caenarcaniphilales bacterium]